jgi:hypothetical protein
MTDQDKDGKLVGGLSGGGKPRSRKGDRDQTDS